MMKGYHFFEKKLLSPLIRFYCALTESKNREKTRLIDEAAQIRGLMPLLMKQRNGYRWDAQDRKMIRLKLIRLSKLSPYLIVLLLPGGFFVLPLLAWYLDRRRKK